MSSTQLLKRLAKSAEVQMQVDDEYFKINLKGHQMRLQLENTLKNCHQVIYTGLFCTNLQAPCSHVCC